MVLTQGTGVTYMTVEEKKARRREQHRAWAVAHPEERKAAKRNYYAAHRAMLQEKARAYFAAFPEKAKEKRRAKYAKDPEKAKRLAHAWYAKRPEMRAAQVARRASQKLQATPAWANPTLIESFYRMAEVFGLHVDHIVPLRSKLICGLHVEHNLQLLTPLENSRKGNKLLQGEGLGAGTAGIPIPLNQLEKRT